MSHAVSCHECDMIVWPPFDAECPGGRTEIAACRLALEHVRESGHTELYVIAGCYYISDRRRPTSFDGEPTDPDGIRVLDRSKMANATAGAARRLRVAADDLEKWEESELAARHLREYADAVESNISREADT